MRAPCGSDGLKKLLALICLELVKKKREEEKEKSFENREINLIKSRRLEIFAENRSFPAKMGGLESLNQTKHYDKY